MPHKQLDADPLLVIQQNTLHKALADIETELSIKHSLDAQLALQGLQAELSGNTQLAVATYAESHHPCAMARYFLLLQTYSPFLLQLNLQVTPSYHSQLTLLPSPLGSLFPSNVSVKKEKSEKPKKSQKKPATPSVKKYHETQFSEEDVKNCITEMGFNEKYVLKRMHGKVTTKAEFSKQYKMAISVLKSIQRHLSQKSLIISWPTLSPFGNVVAQTLKIKKVIGDPAPVTTLPTPTMLAEPSQSFVPMLQLAQTRAAEQQVQAQTAMPISEDAKRVTITNLLNK